MSPKNVSHQPLSATAYVFVWLGALILAGGSAVFYVYELPKLTNFGQAGNIFYLLLLLFGLSCAVFLFGVMRSYARLTDKHFGIVLELGGPVVVFCLVVYGGFRLVPRPNPLFDLTLRAHSADEKDPIVGSGNVAIDLGTDRREAAIGSNGEAIFKGVPETFKDATVTVYPKVEGYDRTSQKLPISAGVIDLPLARENPETTIVGSVTPAPGKGKNIKVIVNGQKAETSPDEFGRFELKVAGKSTDRVRLEVFEDGKLVYDDYQVLSQPARLKLHKPR